MRPVPALTKRLTKPRDPSANDCRMFLIICICVLFLFAVISINLFNLQKKINKQFNSNSSMVHFFCFIWWGVFVFSFNLSLMFKCCRSEIPVLNEILETQPHQFFQTLRESVHEVHFTTSHTFSIPYARLYHSG